MKNLSVLFFLLIAATPMHAQILKGSLPVALDLSFNSHTQKDPLFSNNTIKNTSLTYAINPTAGYFIANNLVLGLGITYSYAKQLKEQQNDTAYYKTETLTQSLQVAPYMGYYIKISDRVYLSLTASVGYQHPFYYHTSGTNLPDDKSNMSYQINAKIAPGILYFLNDKFALQASAGSLYYTYSHTREYTNAYSDTNDGGLNLSLSNITFGAQYFLVRKK